MAHHPSNVSALAGTAETIPSLPSRADLRGAAAVGAAELAVLLLRGSAAAVLLSPLLIAAFFMAD